MHADTEPHTGRGRGEPPSRRAPSKPSSQRVEGATGAIAPTAGRNDPLAGRPRQPQRRSRFPASGGGVHCGLERRRSEALLGKAVTPQLGPRRRRRRARCERRRRARPAPEHGRRAQATRKTQLNASIIGHLATAHNLERGGGGVSTAKICHSDIHTSVLLHSLCASACHLLLVPDPRSAEARGRRSRPPTPQTGRRKRRGRRRHSSDEGGSPWHSRTRASAASAGTRAALFGGGRGLLPLRLLQTPLLLPAAAARRPQSPLPDRCPDTRPEGGLRQRAPPFSLPPPSPLPRPSHTQAALERPRHAHTKQPCPRRRPRANPRRLLRPRNPQPSLPGRGRRPPGVERARSE